MPRRARISLCVSPAWRPCHRAALRDRPGSTSGTMTTRTGRAMTAEGASRSVRENGASGCGWSVGAGATPHWHGPPLIGQNWSEASPLQHVVVATTTPHDSWPQAWSVERSARTPTPTPGIPARMSIRMASSRTTIRFYSRDLLSVNAARDVGIPVFWGPLVSCPAIHVSANPQTCAVPAGASNSPMDSLGGHVSDLHREDRRFRSRGTQGAAPEFRPNARPRGNGNYLIRASLRAQTQPFQRSPVAARLRPDRGIGSPLLPSPGSKRSLGPPPRSPPKPPGETTALAAAMAESSG